MCSDPRNDRPSADDRNAAIDYDAPCCGICDCAVTPENFAAWDAYDVFCVSCSTAAELDYPAGEDETPTDEEYHRPMTTGEALTMAVAAVFEGRTLLNGVPEECDDCEEDETMEIEVALTVETREPIPGLVVRSWRHDGRIAGAEFRDVRRPAVRAIVHGSTKTPGKWQTSYMEAGEPTGDVQAATLDEALRELSPGRWELVAVHGTRRTEAA